MTISPEEAGRIHRILHNSEWRSLGFGGYVFPIRDHKPEKNVRSVRIGGAILFVTQNPDKTSDFASMARAGRKLTWVIHGSKPWGLIVDEGTVERKLPV